MIIPWDMDVAFSKERQKRNKKLKAAWEAYYKNWQGSDRKKERVINDKIKRGKSPHSHSIN